MGTHNSQLHDLLLSLYTAEEFRRAIQHWGRDYEAIIPALPGRTAAHADLVGTAIEALGRHGLIDGGFFQRLTEDRLRRASEIDAVAAAWTSRKMDFDSARARGTASRKPAVPIRAGSSKARAEDAPRILSGSREVMARPDNGNGNGNGNGRGLVRQAPMDSTMPQHQVCRPLRWLHLADLHIGARSTADWEQGCTEFFRSIEVERRPVGFEEVDLVLVTGDVADTGKPEEYKRASKFFEKMLAALARPDGREPVLVPVPGNHDITRPSEKKARRSCKVLQSYHKGRRDEDVAELLEELWQQKDPELVSGLLSAYTEWFAGFVAPRLDKYKYKYKGLDWRGSWFPGDLSVRLDLPQRPPLHIVGLNSAWLAYRKADYREKLVLEADQLHAALSDGKCSGLESLDDVHALLLVHHHPSWFTPAARAEFRSSIYPPSRFLACLHGQAPQHQQTTVAASGGGDRHYIPTYSLLGRRAFIERKGEDEKDRREGYVWGELADDGELRIWPRKRFAKGDGVRGFFVDPNVHSGPGGIVVRKGQTPKKPEPAQRRSLAGTSQRTAESGQGREETVDRVPTLDLTAYCRRVRDRNNNLRLDGIAASAKTLNFPIEQLYTRLRTHSPQVLGAAVRGQASERLGGLGDSGMVHLGEVLWRNRLLLIEGQAGSGKTTFLRLVASVLARDFLQEPCPEGPSWRSVYLSERVASAVPVFLRLTTFQDIADAETAGEQLRGDVLLLKHLAEQSAPASGSTDEAQLDRRWAWERQLVDGGVVLLFDGLDEVGEDARRERLFSLLQDILREWPKCRVIVSSRPFGVERLKDLGFVHVSVAPFAEAEIEDYVGRWVKALFGTDPEKRAGETEEAYADRLRAAIRARGELRRLASSPVMLTCLCVVYSHGGGLPESRAELYRDAIKWLIESRHPLRKKQKYDGFRVQEALSALALEMMGGASGSKRRGIGIREAADCVQDIVRGPAFEIADKPARTNALCEWLRFECEHSGVIEEASKGQLEFRHLTFQEYLAAARMATLGREKWWPMLKGRLEDMHWRETVELFPGCLLEAGSSDHVDSLIAEVHKLWPVPKWSPLVRAAKITAITGRLMPVLRCANYNMEADIAATDKRLRREAEAIFEVEGASQINNERTRIDVAEAIGVAGDRRIARERFEANLLGFGSEDKGLRLGKYLVTVEEYAQFVEDGGYRRSGLWLDEQGWSFREREGWEQPDRWEQQLEVPNRPVVGVSWFEAMAYCRWLTEQHPHLQVRLPTQVEWMRAASPDGRRYPWAGREERDEVLSNFGRRVDAPTPVGLYPAGDGAFGHCDLAGNVWEWSLDVVEDVLVDEEKPKKFGCPRVLCGGSYWENKDAVAAAVCSWYRSVSRVYDFGFRVLAEFASP